MEKAENSNNSNIIPSELIEINILLIRGQKVILGQHLAHLYGVPPKVLIQAVKRNISRFPDDFIFQLSNDEYNILKSQFVTSRWGGLRRAKPYVFTELGIAMLSSVLNSERAIQVNIAIMRVFIKLKQAISINKEVAQKLSELEHKIGRHDQDIISLFNAINKILKYDEKPKGQFGFI